MTAVSALPPRADRGACAEAGADAAGEGLRLKLAFGPGAARPTSVVKQEFLHGHANVLGNLAQQDRRDIAPSVKWHRGPAARRITELAVRPSLPHLDKTQAKQDRDDFRRFQNRNIAHRLRNRDSLHADEF